MLDCSILRALIALFVGRLRAAHGERGASLEYVMVVLGALAVAAIVFAIIRNAARAGASRITIPGN